MTDFFDNLSGRHTDQSAETSVTNSSSSQNYMHSGQDSHTTVYDLKILCHFTCMGPEVKSHLGFSSDSIHARLPRGGKKIWYWCCTCDRLQFRSRGRKYFLER